MTLAPWWWFPREPKHVGAAFTFLMCSNNRTIYTSECVSWTIKYLKRNRVQGAQKRPKYEMKSECWKYIEMYNKINPTLSKYLEIPIIEWPERFQSLRGHLFCNSCFVRADFECGWEHQLGVDWERHFHRNLLMDEGLLGVWRKWNKKERAARCQGLRRRYMLWSMSGPRI